MRCLASDPAQRWPNARSLYEGLVLLDEESTVSLPASVRELPAFGPYAVLWAMLWLTLAASPFRSVWDRALLGFIAILVPAGLVMHVSNVAGGGLSLGQLTRVAFWPPDWWGMWWPRALRRPTDLWRRLPWGARLVRIGVSVFIITLPALILTRQWVEAVTQAPVGWFGKTERALVIGVVALVIVVGWWARRRALSWHETTRLLFGATTSSTGWNTPALRRLLAPAQGGVRPPERDEPADHMRAIDEAVSRLEEPARGEASRAADAARKLVALLDRCDAELHALSLGSGVSETDRIGAQLSALENVGHQDDETRRLAELLRSQLELVHRMRVRCEMLSSRRARLLLLLHGVWTRVSALSGLTPAAERAELARLEGARAEVEAELAAPVEAVAGGAANT
jgi:hypothetical protein